MRLLIVEVDAVTAMYLAMLVADFGHQRSSEQPINAPMWF
jgi:hypothetical protein